MAYIEQSRGNHEEALAHLDAGLNVAIRENRAHQGLKLAITRAIIFMENGRLHEARDAFISLIEKAESFGDYYLMGTIMLNLGDIEWRLGDYPAAERYLYDARNQFSQLGVLNGIAGCHKIKGIVNFLQEKYADAYDEYLESIHLNEKISEMQETWYGYYNLAEVCVKMNRLEEAQTWWEKGMTSFSEKDNRELYRLYLDLKGQIQA